MSSMSGPILGQSLLLLFIAFLTEGTAVGESGHEALSCDSKMHGTDFWAVKGLESCPVETSRITRPEIERTGNESEVNVTTSGKRLACSSNVTSKDSQGIITVASTDLLSVINATTAKNECCAVLFYAEWCHFSAKAAPAFNALSRAIPKLRLVAVDVSEFSPLNSQFGIVGLPTLLFFKNGKLSLRFNTSITLKNVADFVGYHTGEQSLSGIPVLKHAYSWLWFKYFVFC